MQEWGRVPGSEQESQSRGNSQHKVNRGTTAEDAPGWNDGASPCQLIGFVALVEDRGLAFGCEVVEEEGRVDYIGDVAVVGTTFNDED